MRLSVLASIEITPLTYDVTLIAVVTDDASLPNGTNIVSTGRLGS